MKNKFILIYWGLIILLQSFLIYNKLETSNYNQLIRSDFILWNVIAILGAIAFIALRKRIKTNSYEGVLAGFIGINGVIYAIGNLMFKIWTNASLGLIIAIISFLVLYLIILTEMELRKKH